MNREKIALVVDTGCNIPIEMIKEYHMYVLPFKIMCNEKVYLDGVDITAEKVYEDLKSNKISTSIPNTDEIIDLFNHIKEDGYEKVLMFTLSSQLSQLFNIASEIAEDYTALEIEVVDTLNVGIAAGLIAIQAAKYIEEEMDFEQIKESVSKNITKTKLFFCLDTLDYLEESGRIGMVTPIVGTINYFMPIISCNEEGTFYNANKGKGRKKAIEKMLDLAVQYASIGKKYHVALCYGTLDEEIIPVKEKLMQRFPRCDMYLKGEVGAALGVHTGAGVIGIAIQLLDD